MRELLRADWYRVRKSGLFPTLCFCVLAISVLSLLPYLQSEAFIEYPIESDSSNVLMFALLSGAACAILCGYTEETGYTEGIVRNKLISGHTRSRVYWSALLVGSLCGVLFAVIYLAPQLAFQYAFMQPPRDPAAFRTSLVTGFLTVPAFVSLYVTIGAVWGRKGTALACMVVYSALVVIALILMEALNDPEYIENYGFTPEGGLVSSGMVPNPEYIRPPARDVCDFFLRALPSGACLLTAAMEAAGVWLYIAGFTAASCAAGLVAIRRKNIN